MKTRILIALTILGLAALGAAPASAQVNLSPGVARISLIHGDVSTQRGDSGDSAAAAVNAPIVDGDKVSTGDRSRVEVQLDYANILRLSDRSQATIAGLTRTKIQVQLGQGLADFAIFKGTEADVEIDTPNVAIRPALKEGVYRIEVTSEGETRVIVRKGDAEISTPQGSTRLEKGQQATIRGNGDDTQYKVAEAPSKDSWDSWNNERNDTIHNAQSWRHTNNYYVGAEDLDAYGRWVSVPDYGMVWSPAVSVGWVPYRSGRWVWEPYWGWTWVSYEPWGWAPYHYGRWFEYGGSWVWWPGPVYGYGYGYHSLRVLLRLRSWRIWRRCWFRFRLGRLAADRTV
jgi:FecR protein